MQCNKMACKKVSAPGLGYLLSLEKSYACTYILSFMQLAESRNHHLLCYCLQELTDTSAGEVPLLYYLPYVVICHC